VKRISPLSANVDVPLIAFAASRTGKIIENGLVVLKGERICYKMIYYTFYLSQSSEIVLQS